MKTVGKQLQEARLAKNWTPELAARETKIKVERLRDLETDEYSHFSSPTYARGFVRTYARALGLDEYRILRQLDNKLPDDDSANIVTDTGIAYLPETSLPPRAAHRDFTGLYVVMGLGCVVALVSAFVLFEAYRVGELSRWFASPPPDAVASATTNTAPITPATDTTARALPVDSNTPPPIADATTNAAPATNAVADAAPAMVAPRALPVDPSVLGNAGTNAAPVADTTPPAPRALPVDPADLNNNASAPAAPATTPPADTTQATSTTPTTPAPDATPVAPRALPVDPSELNNNTPPPAPGPTTLLAINNVTPTPTPPVATPAPAPPANSGPVVLPPAQPQVQAAPQPPTNAVTPPPDAAPTVTPPTPDPNATTTVAPDTTSDADKRLVLTASQDSFVRVTNLDGAQGDKPLYAAVLHSGQSVGFDGKKFSINVGIPSAVDIKLDGVNYGPHSDQDAPETFVVQSHLP